MKRQKTKVIIVRGCKVRVLAKDAWKHEAAERKLSEKDWNNNQMD